MRCRLRSVDAVNANKKHLPTRLQILQYLTNVQAAVASLPKHIKKHEKTLLKYDMACREIIQYMTILPYSDSSFLCRPDSASEMF